MLSATELAVLVTTLVVLAFFYFKRAFTYWERRHLPQLKPKSPFGNIKNPFRGGIQFKVKSFYDEFKSKGYKHGGVYFLTNPVYMPIDPEYVKNVMARDFNHFIDRGTYYNEKTDPLSAHLFSVDGHKWRKLRTKLTPTFTSGKMKMMFPTLLTCGEQLKDEIAKKHAKKEAVDIKETVACFSTDIIGSCAFGLDLNSFKDPDAEFRKYGKKVFVPSLPRLIKMFFALSVPKFCKYLGMKVIPRDVHTFFMGAIKDLIKYRENNNVTRNDFAQLLIELKNKKLDPSHKGDFEGLTIEEVAAEAFVFFLAGFETSSTVMTFCMYELAKNQDVQDRVRNEVRAVVKKSGGTITYESSMEMKYLEQVIDEALRKYPPVPTLNRVCTQHYTIPGTEVTIEPGTKVMISVYGLQSDPEHYPNPEVFDPERFSDENRPQRHPFTFLPFGEGPRNCIGLRFGMMQTKLGIASMIQNYRFTLNKKVPRNMRFTNKSALLCSIDDILLDIEEIV